MRCRLPRPVATPAATPHRGLPYAAIGPSRGPEPYPSLRGHRSPAGAQSAAVRLPGRHAVRGGDRPALRGTGRADPAVPGSRAAHPAPAPAMHPPFQTGYVAPPPVQPQYASPPAPPAFTAPPAYPRSSRSTRPRPRRLPRRGGWWRPESPYLAPAPSAQGHKAPPPAAGAEPQWPTTPSWPAPLAKGAEAVWAESTRDLLSRPEAGVSACFNCGLPLSATARFCRRCGTSQVSS